MRCFMKKGIRILSALLFIMVILAGCSSKPQLPETPIVYQHNVGNEYAYLTVGDKIFVPYCAYKPSMLGECIGYCDVEATEYSSATREYIYELKGYSSDELIVSVLFAGNFREGMILRELNATEIPEGLSSEYEWNQ